MLPKVFISYRREDSAGAASRLAEHLRRLLGGEHVFLDTDGLDPGVLWEQRLRAELDNCTALLALIGDDWLRAQDRLTGVRRLDQADDPVRREIECALERDLRIIPLCIDDARLPPTAALPRSIASLTSFQALPLRTTDNRQWSFDVSRLLTGFDVPHLLTGDGEIQLAAPVRAAGGDLSEGDARPARPTDHRLAISLTRRWMRDRTSPALGRLWVVLGLGLLLGSAGLIASRNPMPLGAPETREAGAATRAVETTHHTLQGTTAAPASPMTPAAPPMRDGRESVELVVRLRPAGEPCTVPDGARLVLRSADGASNPTSSISDCSARFELPRSALQGQLALELEGVEGVSVDPGAVVLAGSELALTVRTAPVAPSASGQLAPAAEPRPSVAAPPATAPPASASPASPSSAHEPAASSSPAPDPASSSRVLPGLTVSLECAGHVRHCIAQGARLVLDGARDGTRVAVVDARCRARFDVLSIDEPDVRFQLRPAQGDGRFNCALGRSSVSTGELMAAIALPLASCFCGGVDPEQYGFECGQVCPGSK